MKKTIVNIMFTSNAVLILFAVYALIVGIEHIYIRAVLEILGANTAIHLGFFFIEKFESRYVFFEYLLDISYILFILGIFAIFFKWYTYVPMWLFLIMTIAIYIFCVVLNIAKNRKSAKKMNELLQKRKERNKDIVS